ncbi:GTP-binding protein, partial [Suillus variegatus]
MATIEAHDLRQRIRRFRVLIMGRANAGKTTILQKVCNTMDQPEIYDTQGNKIDTAIVESSIKRGNHNITNEMVFKSDPAFVFHDSCGFEAGSEEEFKTMKKFISERAHATKLEERIHVIWYCIPMDDHCRTFQRLEEKFFQECDTGHVPVVVVFTKCEALHPVAYGEIKKQLQGVSGEERSKRIAEGVEELFTKTDVLDWLCSPKNRARPKSYVRLQNLNKPNTNCDTLLESTTLALDDKELRLCLVSTQKSNLELCIKCAIATLVDRADKQIDYG